MTKRPLSETAPVAAAPYPLSVWLEVSGGGDGADPPALSEQLVSEFFCKLGFEKAPD